MKGWYIEKQIGEDFVLINPRGPCVMICDAEGRIVWEIVKDCDFDLGLVHQRVDLPKKERPAFEKFLGYLQEFIDGNVKSKGVGNSLHEYFFERKIPLVVGLEINQDCQLGCRHCYNAKNSSQNRLPFEIIDHLGDDLAQMGTPYVIITGGEPLLHPDFMKICKSLTGKGLAVKVFSNGYAMTEKIARELAAMNIFLVGFTLFGHQAELHEYISSVPGSFERICRAISLMLKYGINIDVTFFLMKHNFQQRQAMFAWAKKEFGRDASYSVSITPCESGSLSPLNLEISREEKRQLFSETGIKIDPLIYGQERTVPCTAGKTLCAVKYDGAVTPCVSLLHSVGSLKLRSFSDIWYNSAELKKFRDLRLKDISGCNECKRSRYCMRCYVSASFLNDLWGKDPHACELARVTEAVSQPNNP